MIKVGRTRVYALYIMAKESGWVEKTNMILKLYRVAGAFRSDRPSIFAEAIAYVLKIITKNSITRGFSYAAISKAIKLRGFHVAPRTV